MNEVLLRQMTEEEFTEFASYSNRHHATELQEEKGMSFEKALLETEEGLKKMLPCGKDTPDHHLMVIQREDKTVVGYMWYIYDHRREDTYLFLSDFHILPEFRRSGYGEAALSAMEEAGRQFCCKRCALFVDDKNQSARKLYEKCGYIYRNRRENGSYMDKEL